MAKTKWPKLPHYLIPLFQNAHVYLCTTKEQWGLACKSIQCPAGETFGMSGLAQTFHDEDTGQLLYLLGVFDGNVATLVHECSHVAFYVCRDTGVPTEASLSSETYCYLQERIFSAFLPHLKQE